jgi:hypothetical protein
MDSYARRPAKVKLQGTATLGAKEPHRPLSAIADIRQALQETSPGSSPVIVATLITLCVIAVLFIVHFHGRDRRDSRREAADPSNRNKFDTTLGEFHDMREALRPLQHTRAASRRVLRNRE